MSAQEWIEAARQVGLGNTDGLLCPEEGDANLNVTWLAGPGDSGAGEWLLQCPGCGARNYVRVGGT